jgi:5-hydroxyisourate hydrolase
MGISTHILDTTRGRPASGVDVTLERATDAGWAPLGRGTTDGDGRVSGLLGPSPEPGTYRVTFLVAPYFAALGVASFYPEVTIAFTVPQGSRGEHFHVPLLLNPFGFTTYRGS